MFKLFKYIFFQHIKQNPIYILVLKNGLIMQILNRVGTKTEILIVGVKYDFEFRESVNTDWPLAALDIGTNIIAVDLHKRRRRLTTSDNHIRSGSGSHCRCSRCHRWTGRCRRSCCRRWIRLATTRTTATRRTTVTHRWRVVRWTIAMAVRRACRSRVAHAHVILVRVLVVRR